MPPQRVVYLTAGAGGMFCGSCMNDNALVRELMALGIDVQLIPTYTPISTDEQNVSIDHVFFGGINVFLQQKFPFLRYLPGWMDGVLNHPSLIRWATRKDVQADPELLGRMTVSMLKGRAGFQRKEVDRLLTWIARDEKPEVINFSNVLIAGCAPDIKARLGVPVLVTLQGDDIFLDYIPDRFRDQAIAEIRKLLPSIDAFVVHSRYYAEYMQQLLGLPSHRVHVVPLGIDTRNLPTRKPRPDKKAKSRIGYLARLTPEKGLHVLVDAFIRLREQRDDVELRIAGWLGTEHQEFAERQFHKLRDAGLHDEFQYLGIVDFEKKLDFLDGLDVFTVPTTYREPKGRFALEAISRGVPVVLPAHGAFPEILADCPAGLLHTPGDAKELAEHLNQMLNQPQQASEMAEAGRKELLGRRSAEQMARRTLDLYQQLCSSDELPAANIDRN